MKRVTRMTSAEKVVRRISDLRDLARRLAKAGYQAGLHSCDPSLVPTLNKVAENSGKYTTRKKSSKAKR
jgi:hypothetical protein